MHAGPSSTELSEEGISFAPLDYLSFGHGTCKLAHDQEQRGVHKKC